MQLMRFWYQSYRQSTIAQTHESSMQPRPIGIVVRVSVYEPREPGSLHLWAHIFQCNAELLNTTVLPAKSDSGVMFCLQNYQDLKLIDHLCINPIRRIYRFSLAQLESTIDKSMFYLTIVNTILRHCHSWLARQ